jgi:hypothetical protein
MGVASAPGHFIHVKVDFAVVSALRSGHRVVLWSFFLLTYGVVYS